MASDTVMNVLVPPNVLQSVLPVECCWNLSIYVDSEVGGTEEPWLLTNFKIPIEIQILQQKVT